MKVHDMMDMFPLYNSVRVALISTAVIFAVGIAAAWYVIKLPRTARSVVDCVFMLPLVLPPTVVGYMLIRLLGPRHPLGEMAVEAFGTQLTMHWWSALFSTSVVIFPLMYRAARGAFESFDFTYSQAGKTLGLSDPYIFFRIVMPNCRAGIVAGTVLSFARALGEYGATMMIAGYTPGRTATISTTVYHLWRTGNDRLAAGWVIINIVISLAVLSVINVFETKGKSS